MNNEEKFKKGIKVINKIKMDDNERMKMFENLSIHIDKSFNKADNLPPYFNLFEVFSRRSFATVFTLVLVFIGLGGLTVFAAENSLPGDFLYPIKVNFNEPIVSKATLNKTAKIEWEAEKVDRRLKEAEILAEKGLLNNISRKEIEDRIVKYSEKFDEITESKKENIKKEKDISEKKLLETENIKINFEENIDEHNKNLEKIEEKLDDEKKEEVKIFRKNLVEKVKNRKEEGKNKNTLEDSSKYSNKKDKDVD